MDLFEETSFKTVYSTQYESSDSDVDENYGTLKSFRKFYKNVKNQSVVLSFEQVFEAAKEKLVTKLATLSLGSFEEKILEVGKIDHIYKVLV